MNRVVSKISMSATVLILLAGSLHAAESPAPDQFVRDLSSGKPGARANAAAELARMGPQAAAAVPALIEALRDESIAVRLEALLALEHIGPAARAAVPGLVVILQGKEDRLLLGAVNALGAIGRDSLDAAGRLSEFLTATDERISVAAAFALARILPGDADEMKPVIKVLVKAVQSKQRPIRGEATSGLMLVGPAAAPGLAQLVSDFDANPNSAVAAAGALRLLGPAAESALPALIQALSSRHDLVASTAADAVGAIGPKATAAMPGLLKLLRSEHPLLRTHAAHNLGLLGTEAKSAVGELTKALVDKDFNVRREAAQSLGEIGTPAKLAVPALVKSLQDDSHPVVLAAAHALSRIGPDAVPALTSLIKDQRTAHWPVVILAELGEGAAPAVETLRTALASADDELAKEIIHALGRIGPAAKESTPELIKILGDKDSALRVPAAFALGNIRSAEALPILKELVQDEDEKDPRLPLVAAGALVLIETPDKEHVKLALPRLIAALEDKSDSVRREAAAALRQIGVPAATAIPALIQGLNDPNPAICIDYLWALTAIASADDSPALVHEMITLLSSAQAQVRYTACFAAGSLGKAATEAIPILEGNLQDHDTFLQVASAWALVRISPEKPGVAEECIDPLIRGLGVSDARVRAEAATSIGLLGPLAQRAVSALSEIRNDPDESVRSAAIEALQRIQHASRSDQRQQRR